MARKRARPAPLATGTGLGFGSCSAALSDPIHSTLAVTHQPDFAIRRLARRFGLPPSTASTIAGANGWGCS